MQLSSLGFQIQVCALDIGYFLLFFKVGWVKADSKAIQAIHNTVITHNQRVEVTLMLHI